MTMEYLNIESVASKWGITPRRLQILCAEGKIPGATRFGRAWMIPNDATKPLDGRRKVNSNMQTHQKLDLPFPRCSPALRLTNLYRTPGLAKQVQNALSSQPYVQVLFAADIAYCKGLIDEAYAQTNTLPEQPNDFYSAISKNMLLAQCAVWQGDLDLWDNARKEILNIKAMDKSQQASISLCICALDGIFHKYDSVPDWFRDGRFESLHKDILPAAKVYYTNYLYSKGQSLTAQVFGNDAIMGLAMLKLLPGIIEPMIAQAMADETVIAEIYLRLTCATAYHFCKKDEISFHHIDRAIELAIPDKLYGILAEYCMTLSTVIEQRIRQIAPSVWDDVSQLFEQYASNWFSLKKLIVSRRNNDIPL